MLTFTKEIKEKWLEALRSGNYNHGKGKLQPSDTTHCCLGVLCVIHPELGIAEDRINMIHDETKDQEGYLPLQEALGIDGEKLVKDIWYANDISKDYSRVIPLIEALPTQD